MTETNNGFVLSEEDLKLRGPGEVFGFRQSGIPQFIAGDLVADANILEVARSEAQNIWQMKNWQVLPAYKGLAEAIKNQTDEQFFD